ncbi:hypothetical protein HK103_004102 [Boothiomyces macroporosus]|uniref:Uncharacterized protein n=1 Tax=Boothiomyces macroporosus TaxID=261099 RepID=A0AAD5UJZ4_9FUNG|nr:hypothetical protein HK103_004102 [Boothiomyces macroporosus]
MFKTIVLILAASIVASPLPAKNNGTNNVNNQNNQNNQNNNNQNNNNGNGNVNFDVNGAVNDLSRLQDDISQLQTNLGTAQGASTQDVNRLQDIPNRLNTLNQELKNFQSALTQTNGNTNVDQLNALLGQFQSVNDGFNSLARSTDKVSGKDSASDSSLSSTGSNFKTVLDDFRTVRDNLLNKLQ